MLDIIFFCVGPYCIQSIVLLYWLLYQTLISVVSSCVINILSLKQCGLIKLVVSTHFFQVVFRLLIIIYDYRFESFIIIDSVIITISLYSVANSNCDAFQRYLQLSYTILFEKSNKQNVSKNCYPTIK